MRANVYIMCNMNYRINRKIFIFLLDWIMDDSLCLPCQSCPKNYAKTYIATPLSLKLESIVDYIQKQALPIAGWNCFSFFPKRAVEIIGCKRYFRLDFCSIGLGLGWPNLIWLLTMCRHSEEHQTIKWGLLVESIVFLFSVYSRIYHIAKWMLSCMKSSFFFFKNFLRTQYSNCSIK